MVPNETSSPEPGLLDRWFGLRSHQTTLSRELVAGLITFLTMAYIIAVQPAVLSGEALGQKTGMDAGTVMTATCLAAALATAVMGLYARYPIAQAPGMGENFFFVLSAIPVGAAVLGGAAGEGWRVALGAVFWSGIIFLFLSLIGVRERIFDAVSPSMKHAIGVGIGLFIAFIGLRGSNLVVADPGTLVTLNKHFTSPDILVFAVGFLVIAVLQARQVPGSILWGIVAATLLAITLKYGLPASRIESEIWSKSMLQERFQLAETVVRFPPSLAPTFFRMDVVNALHFRMLPLVLIFLFMLMFDTIGTLIAVCNQAGLLKENKLPRVRQALVSDALGTVAGACLGTSTVTSFIESGAGVQHGGRTGLTALTVAVLFLLALFFSPIVQMVSSYPPLTAPALVFVGSMMMRGVEQIEWDDTTEAIPSFLTIIGIPLAFSIADGMALGLITYPIVKLLGGKGKDVPWVMYLMALILIAYFVLVRGSVTEG